MSKESNQHRSDQVPTLTSKSSGLNYLSSNMEPAQAAKVEKREPSTKNDKGS